MQEPGLHPHAPWRGLPEGSVAAHLSAEMGGWQGPRGGAESGMALPRRRLGEGSPGGIPFQDKMSRTGNPMFGDDDVEGTKTQKNV